MTPSEEAKNLARPQLTTPTFLYRLFHDILPLARQEIQAWTSHAQTIPDPVLRHEALASLHHKRFHADGGCVYAAEHLQCAPSLVRLIIALQTISDYLDNLCDRATTMDPADYHQLHHAMRDAVQPAAALRDYYALRGSPDDNGYLNALVKACQQEVLRLPGYQAALPYVTWLVERYCELQEYKHIEIGLRQRKLESWSAAYVQSCPGLAWWEWCAATGSTLGMFALFAAAADDLSDESAKSVFESYFPWVCGLHILLDYLIDLEEDEQEQDFNFVRCYPPSENIARRLRTITRNSLRRVERVPGSSPVHRYVVRGLLAMYLSDRKAAVQPAVRPVRGLIRQFGVSTMLFYGACKLYRVVR